MSETTNRSAESKVNALLSQLAQVAIDERDVVQAAESRYQRTYHIKEVQHREAVAALERNREAERDNDHQDCEIRKQRIYEDFQEKREKLVQEIKRAEAEVSLPTTSIATYPDQPEGGFPEEPDPTATETGPSDTGSPVALVDVIRENADGEIETETNYPHIPSQKNVLPRWIPIGTRVWIINPLKLKEAVSRTHLQGNVVRHGTLYHILKIWNPVTNKHEEHRRHRDNIAIVE